MTILEQFIAEPMTHAVGWTLVHFLWQGALIAVGAGAALHLLRNAAPEVRYAVLSIGMGLMLAAPVVTAVVLAHAAPEPVEAAALELFLLDLGSLPLWEQLSPYLPWLTLFWLAGTLLLQGRLVLNWTRALRMKTRGVEPATGEWQEVVDELCRRLKVRQSVRLLKSSAASVPMVLGWIRPVILVPGYALTGLTADQLKAVLAHELAHIQRHDYLVNLVQALFESVLFYHPAVWWLSSRLRAEREYCCDDVAVRTCRDALCYARALSSLDEMRDKIYQTAIATTGGSLMKRIFRIVGVNSDPSFRLGGWFVPLLFVLSMTAAVSAMSLSSGQDIVSAMAADSDSPNRAVQEDDIDAVLKKKEQALVEKMRAAGKSDKEIKVAVMDLHKKFELKLKEEQIIKKMKSAGKSDKEIKHALAEFHKSYGAPADLSDKELEYKKKEEQLIKKMSAAGKTKAEIKQAVADLRMKRVRKKEMVDSAVLFKAKEEDLIKAMKADGKSKAEIKQAVMELREAYRDKQKEKEFHKKVDAMVIQMKKDGMSDDEIKRAVKKMYGEKG